MRMIEFYSPRVDKNIAMEKIKTLESQTEEKKYFT